MGPVVDTSPLPKMPRGRILVAIAVTAFVVSGQLFDVVCGCEHWPFSDYAMYSEITTRRETEMIRAYGVTSRDEETWSPDQCSPLDPVRLSCILANHNDNAALSVAADALMKLANANPAGAQLTRMRIYRCRWEHDGQTRNFDRPERTLLAESADTRDARE